LISPVPFDRPLTPGEECKDTEGLANPSGLWNQSSCIQLHSNLYLTMCNRSGVRLRVGELLYRRGRHDRSGVVPRQGSNSVQWLWSSRSTYDHAAQPRVWILPPLFKFAMALIYTMRRSNAHLWRAGREVPGPRASTACATVFDCSWPAGRANFPGRKRPTASSVLDRCLCLGPVVVAYGLKHRVLENIRVIASTSVCAGGTSVLDPGLSD